MRFIVQKKPEKMSSQAFVIAHKYNSAMTKSPRKIWVINVMVVLVEDSDFVDQGLYLIVAYYC